MKFLVVLCLVALSFSLSVYQEETDVYIPLEIDGLSLTHHGILKPTFVVGAFAVYGSQDDPSKPVLVSVTQTMWKIPEMIYKPAFSQLVNKKENEQYIIADDQRQKIQVMFDAFSGTLSSSNNYQFKFSGGETSIKLGSNTIARSTQVTRASFDRLMSSFLQFYVKKGNCSSGKCTHV